MARNIIYPVETFAEDNTLFKHRSRRDPSFTKKVLQVNHLPARTLRFSIGGIPSILSSNQQPASQRAASFNPHTSERVRLLFVGVWRSNGQRLGIVQVHRELHFISLDDGKGDIGVIETSGWISYCFPLGHLFVLLSHDNHRITVLKRQSSKMDAPILSKRSRSTKGPYIIGRVCFSEPVLDQKRNIRNLCTIDGAWYQVTEEGFDQVRVWTDLRKHEHSDDDDDSDNGIQTSFQTTYLRTYDPRTFTGVIIPGATATQIIERLCAVFCHTRMMNQEDRAVCGIMASYCTITQ